MGTRPNRSAGVIPDDLFLNKIVDKKGRKIRTSYKELEKDNGSYFKITRTGPDTKTWYFAMLPAVESALQYSPNSLVKGQFGIPEVKPGLLNNTTLKYKNFIVPGGLPVVQSIGVQSTTFQVVGLIIGTDGFGVNNPGFNPIYRINQSNNDQGYSGNKNAARAAIEFDEEIAQKMQVVSIEVKSDVIYKFKGVILNFKYYQRRANNTYYVIDFLATEYGNRNK